jgi:transposase
MSYSEDVRRLVIQHVSGGGSKAEAARLYDVCRATVYLWLREGEKKKVPPKTRRRKIDSLALKESVAARPDQTLAELGRSFGVHYSAISYALKRLDVTRKKNLAIF